MALAVLGLAAAAAVALTPGAGSRHPGVGAAPPGAASVGATPHGATPHGAAPHGAEPSDAASVGAAPSGAATPGIASSGTASSSAAPSDATPPRVPAHLARPTREDPAALAADEAPPSAYDLQREGAHLPPEDRTLMAQLWRTVMALALVVVLLYAVARLVRSRLAMGAPGAAGKRMRVVERLALDPRHALVLVELADGSELVLGVGEGRVAPVARLPLARGAAFADVLGDAARPHEVPRADAG